jgi:cysteinyl-tRNA synthetase
MATLAAPANLRAGEGRQRISAVQSWGYQLQGKNGGAYDLPALAASPFDLLVVDYADDSGPLSRVQVEKLKRRRGGGSRLVVAYLSVGEAESYRFYWRPDWNRHPPPFLGPVNPNWPGNYKVRYWMEAWQKILFGVPVGENQSYLDRVLDAGFDGVYVDIIDAFEFFGPDGRRERSTAPRDMARLVRALADYARQERKHADWLVIPQNGSRLIVELDELEAESYLAAIDAIGAEDTFFCGDLAEDNPLHVQQDVLNHLKRFQAAGKPVLAVEYLRNRRKARRFVNMARRYGFVPYVARRELDRLEEQPD